MWPPRPAALPKPALQPARTRQSLAERRGLTVGDLAVEARVRLPTLTRSAFAAGLVQMPRPAPVISRRAGIFPPPLRATIASGLHPVRLGWQSRAVAVGRLLPSGWQD